MSQYAYPIKRMLNGRITFRSTSIDAAIIKKENIYER